MRASLDTQIELKLVHFGIVLSNSTSFFEDHVKEGNFIEQERGFVSTYYVSWEQYIVRLRRH